MLALKQCFLSCVPLSPQTLLIGMPSFQALAAILLKADSFKKKNTYFQGFPGCSVVGSSPANAGDMGLIPGPGSHIPWSNRAQGPQLLSLCSVLYLVAQSCPTLCDPVDCSPPGSSVVGDFTGKQKLQLLSPCTTTTEACVNQSLCSATKEATTMRSPHNATREQPLLATTTTREKSVQQRRPSIAINKEINKFYSF